MIRYTGEQIINEFNNFRNNQSILKNILEELRHRNTRKMVALRVQVVILLKKNDNTSRPFFYFTGDQLNKEFKNQIDNQNLLTILLEELEYRKAPKMKELKKIVSRRLCQMDNSK